MDTETRTQKLQHRLRNGPVVIGDGGMGTQLYRQGAPHDAVFEYLNLVDEGLVSRVHQGYLEAGSELIETNTFGANALRLSSYGLDRKTEQINLAGARLARNAAGDNRWVAGSVGPLIGPKGILIDLTPTEKRELFLRQMTALAQGGVDCFLLETFNSLADLMLAIEVAHHLARPAIAQLAFNEGGFSGDGLTVEQAAERLAQKGPAAVGANCGAGPQELANVLKRLASASNLPLSAFPNSGYPEYVNGRHIYLATPHYFAALAREMVQVGVTLLGGCCGTMPEHIKALHDTLHGQLPGPRVVQKQRPLSKTEPLKGDKRQRTFLSDWGRRPIITVELDVPRGLTVHKTVEKARVLAEAGVDAINLAENPLARIRMGNLALGKQIQDQIGIEVIAHVTGRDRNLLGLHSDLMGAHLIGIRNVLAVTGDPVAVTGEVGASSVFDVNSIGLLELLSALNRGKTVYGADLGGRTDFLLGAAFNPNVIDLRGQLHKLEKKLSAGACFVQTQPVYDSQTLARLAEALQNTNVPVLVGILPLVSGRNAEFLHNEVPGIVIPEQVREQMYGKAGQKGIDTGMQIAMELLDCASNYGFKGYYLIPPFGKVDLAIELVRHLRQRVKHD